MNGKKKGKKKRDDDFIARVFRLNREIRKTPRKGKGKKPPKGGTSR